MAITKLSNLKEAKSGNRAQHLKNSINYIFNPRKTENQALTGSNCGVTEDEIYQAMIKTKRKYGQEWGRQGYHFVLSLAPGEGSDEIMYSIGKDFCKTYLSEYDYCFAVHNDQPHKHCHIVFNSVNRISGCKYRYENGDWARWIQPVTDRLCEKYGISTLAYSEDKTDQKGTSYAENAASRRGNPTLADIIKYDIDHAVNVSDSFDGFLEEMENMGYIIRRGHSEKHNRDYLTYTMLLPDGERRSKRDLSLKDGYYLEDIKKRIADRDRKRDMKPVFLYTGIRLISVRTVRLSFLQSSCFRRVQQAQGYHWLDTVVSDQMRIHRDLMQIEKLTREANYLIANDIRTIDAANSRIEDLKKRIKELKNAPAPAEAEEEKKRREEIAFLRSEKNLLRAILRDAPVSVNIRDIPPDKSCAVVPQEEISFNAFPFEKNPPAEKDEIEKEAALKTGSSDAHEDRKETVLL